MKTTSESKTKPIELINDPKRIQVLLDDTRSNILNVLEDGMLPDGTVIKDFAVTEVAERLNTNPQRLYHHVDKLLEHKLIIKTREERKKRSFISFYSKAAYSFIVNYTSSRNNFSENERIDLWLKNFSSVLNIRLTNEEKQELKTLFQSLIDLGPQLLDKYSNNTKRESTDYIYFLLEYFIYLKDEEASEIIDKIKEIIDF